MSRKIKVLIVDDSFLMRRIISDIINSDSELEVVGKAQDGQEALQKLVELAPDVVTLDINLPGQNGIDVLCDIMKTRPTRVVMLSAYSRAGASATMRALELGAVDFIAKPSGEISLGLEKLKDEIIAKVKLAASIDLDKYLSCFKSVEEAPVQPTVTIAGIKKIVVVGASTGGPKATLTLMREIPADIPAAFLIVQHMPKGFTASFAERISWDAGIRTKEAEDNDVLEPARAYVAPAGFHMILKQHNDKIIIRLNQEPPVNFVRPSVDVTLLSCVQLFGKDTIAVILTGMGKDGLEGSRRVKELGGVVFVQDEDSSVVWGMPGSVARAGLANAVAPLPQLAQLILKQIHSS
ncbi:MAG: chemotaxis response regulator protein-glutamate methylesterase [Candidatus Omnitrophica bacterium]|nr:chemotaxis response regulator protein-glutamate methylesterase [Candidatus Omnitrophota bacterium]